MTQPCRQVDRQVTGETRIGNNPRQTNREMGITVDHQQVYRKSQSELFRELAAGPMVNKLVYRQTGKQTETGS